MKSRFFLSRLSSHQISRPISRPRLVFRSASGLLCLVLPFVMLSACTVSEVTPEVGTTAGGGEAKPEMAVRLPSIRLANRAVTAIDTLAEEKVDKTVTISGQVMQRSALLDGWLYQIRDESGTVWVLSEKSTPQVDQAVMVEGVVRYAPIVVGEIDASGVYIEERAFREANE